VAAAQRLVGPLGVVEGLIGRQDFLDLREGRGTIDRQAFVVDRPNQPLDKRLEVWAAGWTDDGFNAQASQKTDAG
jgi:hypothetical protein